MAERTALTARTFDATARSAQASVTVAGVVADDHRYRATVSLNGRPLYEEIVLDDARWLRVTEPTPFAAAAGASADVDALLSGAWVVDAAGAPAEFGPADEEAGRPLSPRLVVQTVRSPEQLPALLTSGGRVRAWDPDSVDYQPSEDRFPEHAADGMRFDVLPEPFDPSTIALNVQTLERFFRHAAIWVSDGRLTRVEKVLSVPTRADPQYRSLFEQVQRGLAGTPSALVAEVFPADVEGAEITERHTYAPAPGATVEPPPDATEIDLDAALDVVSARLLAGSAPASAAFELPLPAGVPGFAP